MCITMRKKRVNKKRKRSDFDLITEIDFNLTLEERYKKKIEKFAKNHGLNMEDIEFRAYAVEGGPTANTWYSEGVAMKNPGKACK